jgi:hypothetical protein
MPLLEVGSMDLVKTGFEVMPEEKLVKVKIAKPKTPEAELRTNKDGKSKTLSFGIKVGWYSGVQYCQRARKTMLLGILSKMGNLARLSRRKPCTMRGIISVT